YHVLYRGSRVLARALDPRTIGQALLSELESLLFAGRDDAAYIEGAFLRSNGASAVVPGVLGPILDGLGRKVPRAGIKLPITGFVSVDLTTGLLRPIEPLLDIPPDAPARLHSFRAEGAAEDAMKRPDPNVASVDGPQVVDVICGVGMTDASRVQPATRGTMLQRMV